MNKREDRSMTNILSLSISKNFTDALKEWHYSGSMRMIGEMSCQLCGQKGLHRQFEIANKLLGNNLWVGSDCIEKFDIYIEDEKGQEVTTGKAAYLTKQIKINYIAELLSRILNTNPTGLIGSYQKSFLDIECANKFLQSQKLNLKQINYIFMRLDEEDIAYEKKHFAVTDTNENYSILINMKELQYRRVEPILPEALKIEWEQKRRSSRW